MTLKLTKEQQREAELKCETYGRAIFVYETQSGQIYFSKREPKVYNEAKGIIIFHPKQQ